MNEHETILLVDDNEDDMLLMREAFNRAKCSHPLQEAHNGEEAVAYLKGEGSYSDRAKSPLPVIMLLDLNMPKMNGFQVLAWARAQPAFKHLPIYILTASARTEDVDKAYHLGATSFLVKPIGLESLTIMMRRLCDWVQISHFPPLNKDTVHIP